MWVDIEAVLEEHNLENLHDNVQSELKLAATNCKYHKLMSAGTNAIEEENIKGKVGRLNLSLLKLDHLEAIIKDIQGLRCNELQAKNAPNTAMSFSVRNDMQSSMLESVFEAYKFFRCIRPFDIMS